MRLLPLRAAALAVAAATTAPVLAQDAGLPVTIAAVGPMTETYARIGGQIRAGVEAAVATINASGGVLGRRLSVTIADDACDSARAVEAARALASEVRLVIGHACSAASAAASSIYARRRVIQISPAAGAPAYTDQRPDVSVFRIAPRDDRQGPFLGAALAELSAGRRVAFLHDGTAYGDSLAASAQAAFRARGGVPVLDRSFEPAARDDADIVEALRDVQADLVFVGGYAVDAAAIARAIAGAGLTASLIGGDTLIDPEYLAAAGDTADGTVFSAMANPATDPANAAIVATLRAAGIEPAGFTLYAYAAVEVWAAAAEKADSFGFDAVTGALNIERFPTVLGEVDFDELGDATLSGYQLYQWRDGRIEPLPR